MELRPVLAFMTGLSLSVLAACTFNPTGGGSDWEQWYFGYGPSEGSGDTGQVYYAAAEVEPSTGPGAVVVAASRRWSAPSRTPAQACTDFRQGLAAQLRGVRQDPEDGTQGCVITADEGRVTVTVTPHAKVTPQGVETVGTDIIVTERRP